MQTSRWKHKILPKFHNVARHKNRFTNFLRDRACRDKPCFDVQHTNILVCLHQKVAFTILVEGKSFAFSRRHLLQCEPLQEIRLGYDAQRGAPDHLVHSSFESEYKHQFGRRREEPSEQETAQKRFKVWWAKKGWTSERARRQQKTETKQSSIICLQLQLDKSGFCQLLLIHIHTILNQHGHPLELYVHLLRKFTSRSWPHSLAHQQFDLPLSL